MKQRLPAKRTTGWTSNLLAAAGDVLVPLLFAFGVGSIFSLICGCNPFTLYSYIIKKAFFSVGGLLNTLGYTTPIIITGMATALSIRANMPIIDSMTFCMRLRANITCLKMAFRIRQRKPAARPL